MKTQKLIGYYQNGNYGVLLLGDGTKIRINTLDSLIPAFPESIDLKISDRCDMGCMMCHEQSTEDGALGDLHAPFLDTLHPYTELALGGGNPLEHPGLYDFLVRMKAQHVVCNLTVHMFHFWENRDKLMAWAEARLIHGLGISISAPVGQDFFDVLRQFPNAVIHIIAGYTRLSTVQLLYDQGVKLLILGYKYYGRGKNFASDHPQIADSIQSFLQHLPELVNHFSSVSFDNLAIQQLNVKRLVDDKKWDSLYMGDDGQYTMYIDLVKQQYAVSSTSPRKDIVQHNIDDMFRDIQQAR